MRIFVILLISILFQSFAYAKHNSEHPLSEQEWQELMEKVTLLDESAYMPSLLPIIMANRDALNLSEEQINKFIEWRKNNYVNMVNIMNEIIEKKVQFNIDALSTDVRAEDLLAFQAEIHRLQRKLLTIRLSCRDIIMSTFTPEQWENFAFVVADNPRIASYFSQASNSRTDSGK